MTEAIKYSFENGQLSTSQRLGILTLIPKKDKDRLLLRNWRPVSLLTTDYKLITKILALRLSKALPSIIHQDQTAYIKGRYIGENIRTIADIIEYCKQKQMTGVLLLIDFEKAFDTIKWNFLHKTLQSFNFGKSFRKWIKIIYNNIQSTVINNGYFSDYFYLYRGMRQGCPISAYLFIIVVEILAISIRANSKIHGLKLRNREIKVSQLADDTTLILNDENSIPVVKDVLLQFYKCSGLKTNIDKTQAFLMGKHMKRFKKTYDLTWKTGHITVLGITFCENELENYKHNYEPKIKKIKSLLTIWRQRRLSLKGKITILNSLAASLLVYPCTNLQTPDRVIQEIEKLFFKFLWDGGNNKISKATIIQSIQDGGLKMVDFANKVKSLKIMWIKRALINPQSSWKLMIDEYLGDITFDTLIKFKSNCETYTVKLPTFYKEIFQIWNQINNFEPNSRMLILQETIWLNNKITVENKPFLWKEWWEKGIQTIDNLLDSEGNFLSCDDLNTKYGVKCSFIEHLRIRQAIPYKWRKIISITDKSNKKPISSNSGIYVKIKNKIENFLQIDSRKIYWLLIDQQTHNHIPTCVKRWEDLYEIDTSIWPQIFRIPFTACRETYLQSFQYRIIHRILPCNEWLQKRNIVNSDVCTYNYCTSPETDSIKHYLITCELASRFWQSVVTWWNKMETSMLNPLVEENILLGFPGTTNEDIVLNFCLILAKYYIYNSKRNQKQIVFLGFLKMLKHKLVVEEAIQVKNLTPTNFYNIWGYLFEQI